jgi:TolB-like protein/DNA-binding winged helix-turn-helix (wHTH) protein/Tfp pilus assembly protein PilF
MHPRANHSGALRFGVYEFDPAARELRKSGLKIRLQEQPLQILAALLERAGEILSRDDLRRRLWSDDTFVDFDRSLNTAIGRLREALDDSADNPRFIETVPRRGYRFIAPVEKLAGKVPAQNDKEAVPASAMPVPATATPAPPALRRWTAAGVALLAAVTVGLFLVRQHPPKPAPAGPGRIMLAVLPFRNLSGDPAQDFASDAMTEEMIAHLGRLTPASLGVIARTSVMKYRNSIADVKTIGRDLGVDYVLEGSVRRGPDQVDVTAQLIQVRDQTHLWAETYERRLTDLFPIERDIARRIAQSLALRLLPAQEAALARATTLNTGAYQAWLEGTRQLREGTKAGFESAAVSFARATTIDPAWALAWDGIARAWLKQADYHFISSEDALAHARPAVEKALAADESIPESHLLLAEVLNRAGPRHAAAEQAYRRALELNPSNADAHLAYASYLRDAQRYAESLGECRESVRLDPQAPFSYVALGWTLLSMGRLEEARREFRKSLDIDSNYPAGLYFLARVEEQQGRVPEAIALLQKAVTSSGRTPKYLNALAIAYLLAGRRDEARRILDELRAQSSRQYVDAQMISLLVAKLNGK